MRISATETDQNCHGLSTWSMLLWCPCVSTTFSFKPFLQCHQIQNRKGNMNFFHSVTKVSLFSVASYEIWCSAQRDLPLTCFKLSSRVRKSFSLEKLDGLQTAQCIPRHLFSSFWQLHWQKDAKFQESKKCFEFALPFGDNYGFIIILLF